MAPDDALPVSCACILMSCSSKLARLEPLDDEPLDELLAAAVVELTLLPSA